ncbi:hypothetical protein J6590_053305 [Homalodisca vitripennis]|nr:hypothetical protein J6590_053305 [Homalodisca vitripennis]
MARNITYFFPAPSRWRRPVGGNRGHNLNSANGRTVRITHLIELCGPECGFGSIILRIVPRLNIVLHKDRSRALVDILRLENAPSLGK